MGLEQIVAGAVAGIIAPFLQEAIFGTRVTGRAAAALAAGIAFVLGLFTTWATNGFAGAVDSPAFNLLEPREFIEFWLVLFMPVYTTSQLFYSLTTKRSDHPPATGPIQSAAKPVQRAMGTDKPQ